MAGQIEMEVIAVEGIVLRAEHRSEFLAGAVMHDAKEMPLEAIAVPAAFHRNHASISQEKRRDVERVGVTMLR